MVIFFRRNFEHKTYKSGKFYEGLEKKIAALKLYRKGAAELERGLGVSLTRLTGKFFAHIYT